MSLYVREMGYNPNHGEAVHGIATKSCMESMRSIVRKAVDSGPFHKSASGFGVVVRATTVTQQKRG